MLVRVEIGERTFQLADSVHLPRKQRPGCPRGLSLSSYEGQTWYTTMKSKSSIKSNYGLAFSNHWSLLRLKRHKQNFMQTGTKSSSVHAEVQRSGPGLCPRAETRKHGPPCSKQQFSYFIREKDEIRLAALSAPRQSARPLAAGDQLNSAGSFAEACKL